MPDSTNASHERSAPLPSQPSAPDRRGFLLGAAALAATPLATHGSGKLAAAAGRPIDNPATDAVTLSGRRRLGSLEVSGIGLGCQTMPGNLYGPVSSRANMISLIRTAVDQGVTLFDTAEAYGPFESERIVGEALRPVRDHVVIASKFGWNIDLETGERGPGFNSRPEHIGPAVEGMLKRLRTDHIDLLYQHRRSGGPDRGRRRRGRGIDLGREGAALGSVRTRAGNRPAGARHTAAHGDPERVQPDVAGGRGGGAAVVRGTGPRFRLLGAAGLRLHHRHDQSGDALREGDFRAWCPATRART